MSLNNEKWATGLANDNVVHAKSFEYLQSPPKNFKEVLSQWLRIWIKIQVRKKAPKI
jgi:hypothetical protein